MRFATVAFRHTFILTLLLAGLSAVNGIYSTTGKKIMVDLINTDRPGVSSKENIMDVILEEKANPEEIRRKLVRLPGVTRISVIEESEINNRMSKINKNLGVDTKGLNAELQFGGLKVYLDKEMPEKSVSLIKDYIKRLSGNYKVVMRVQNSKSLTDLPTFKFLLQYGQLIMGVLLLSVWLVVYTLWSHKFNNFKYLFSQFQRSKTTIELYEVLLVGIPALASFVISLVVFKGQVDIYFLLPWLLCFMAMKIVSQIKKAKWVG